MSPSGFSAYSICSCFTISVSKSNLGILARGAICSRLRSSDKLKRFSPAGEAPKPEADPDESGLPPEGDP